MKLFEKLSGREILTRLLWVARGIIFVWLLQKFGVEFLEKARLMWALAKSQITTLPGVDVVSKVEGSSAFENAIAYMSDRAFAHCHPVRL